jgi:hypothetical protein
MLSPARNRLPVRVAERRVARARLFARNFPVAQLRRRTAACAKFLERLQAAKDQVIVVRSRYVVTHFASLRMFRVQRASCVGGNIHGEKPREA